MFKYFKMILFVCYFGLTSFLFGQISSEEEGGYWGDTLTWVERTVPDSNDNVIIKGTVTGSGKCNNLFIDTGAILEEADVEIFGNLENNGIIRDNDPDKNWSSHRLKLHGNFFNNGLITINYLELKGPQGRIHHFSQSDSVSIGCRNLVNNGSADDSLIIIADSSLIFENCVIDPGEFSAISVSESKSISFINSRLGNAALEANGNHIYFSDSSYLYFSSKLIDARIHGRMGIKGSAVLRGKTIVEEDAVIVDTLFGANSDLDIYDTLINKGEIIDNPLCEEEDFRSLVINNYSPSITNEGVWRNGVIKFLNSGVCSLKSTTPFEPANMALDSGVTVSSGTDLILGETKIKDNNISDEKTVTLELNGNRLKLTGTDNFIQNCIIDNAVLQGNIHISSGVFFTGTTIIEDTIQEFSNHPKPVFSGILINKGIIKDNEEIYNGFSIHVEEKLRNDGVISCTRLYLGKENDTVHISGDQALNPAYIEISDSTAVVSVDSNLTIDTSRVLLNGGNLVLDKNAVLSITGKPVYSQSIQNGTISGGTIKMTESALLGSSLILSTTHLCGICILGSSITFQDTVWISDTCMSVLNSQTIKITSNGTLINNGGLYYTGNGYFNVDAYGSVVNNGFWKTSYINLKGSEDQIVSFGKDKPLNNQTCNLEAYTGTDNFQWLKDGEDIAGKTSSILSISDTVNTSVEGAYTRSSNEGVSRKISIYSMGISAEFTSDSTAVEVKDTVYFSSKATGQVTEWLWIFGDGDSSNAENPSHCYSSAGNYDVRLVVRDNSGNVDSITKEAYITVDQETNANLVSRKYPFSMKTHSSHIMLSLPQKGSLSVNAYTLSGKRIPVINNAVFQKGLHRIDLKGSGIVRGSYIINVLSNFGRIQRKCIIQ